MSAWLPWFYQYGVGGLIAGLIFYKALRAGALGRSQEDRMLARALVCGGLLFALAHAAWIGGAR